MLNQFEPLIKLSSAEEVRFANFIKSMRKVHIKSPKETAHLAMLTNQVAIESMLNNGKISEAILELRQLSYDEFLKEEPIFNDLVHSEMGYYY